MPEVNVQGVRCEFEVNDSVARAFNRLGLKFFSDPAVMEDFKRWDREQEMKKANEQETRGTETNNMADM